MPTHWGKQTQGYIRPAVWILLALLACVLNGCASQPAGVTAPSPLADAGQHPVPVRAVLIGEQHDAPDHHQQQQRILGELIVQKRLAALLLEMADDGVSTAHMPPDASEVQIQQALQWRNNAWPWENYAPSIMLAVRAGVPVLGANLPRAQMPAAMRDTGLNTRVPDSVWAHQLAAIEKSHCGRIPQDRLPAMARIQIARDERMARAIERAIERVTAHTVERLGLGAAPLNQAQEKPVVVLLAGSAHVLRRTGIPLHLQAFNPHIDVEIMVLQSANVPPPSMLDVSTVIQTAAVPEQDYCAQIP